MRINKNQWDTVRHSETQWDAVMICNVWNWLILCEVLCFDVLCAVHHCPCFFVLHRRHRISREPQEQDLTLAPQCDSAQVTALRCHDTWGSTTGSSRKGFFKTLKLVNGQWWQGGYLQKLEPPSILSSCPCFSYACHGTKAHIFWATANGIANHQSKTFQDSVQICTQSKTICTNWIKLNEGATVQRSGVNSH